jgi:homoserine dehydrogenase
LQLPNLIESALEVRMKLISLVMVGFGSVGRAFARLIERKEVDLERQGLQLIVTGIATGRHGSAIDPAGISLRRALELVERGERLDSLSAQAAPVEVAEFIYACPGQVLLENTPVNHHTGEPATTHLRIGLQKGMHAITANKGPVVHAYAELMALAARHGKRFMFESAVMDGAPIFSLFRGPLPLVDLRGFSGILNSCTNLLLERMEAGETLEQATRYAQSIGITETDPSADIDGWDAAIKVAALCTVLMGIPHRPQDVAREGIRGVTPDMMAEARSAGERWKLVCSAQLNHSVLTTSVKPQRVSPTSPLFAVGGTSSFVQFETDVLPGLGILESNPGPETTAYGLLADLLNALRGQ